MEQLHHIEDLPLSYLLSGATPGRPLPEGLRLEMERAFGSDFGDVRIHEGPMAPRHGGLALTLGNHVFVAPHLLTPGTPRERALIAHELVHVLQQRASRLRFEDGRGALAPPSNAAALEEEALRIGKAACSPEARDLMPVLHSDSSYEVVAPQQVDLIPSYDNRTVRTVTENVLVSVTCLLAKGKMTGGSAPSNQLHPKGFVSGTCPHHHQRGHMIGNKVGGSGTTLDNLVTLTEGTNHPFMYDYEDQIYKHVSASHGASFIYEVQAFYDENKYEPVQKPIPQGAAAGAAFGACGNPYCPFPCPSHLLLYFKDSMQNTYPLAHLIPWGSNFGNGAYIPNGIYKFHQGGTTHQVGKCWAVTH